jgi:hypothetical protein
MSVYIDTCSYTYTYIYIYTHTHMLIYIFIHTGAGGALMAPNSVAMAVAGDSQDGDDSGDDPFDDAMFNVVHDCSLGGPGC